MNGMTNTGEDVYRIWVAPSSDYVTMVWTGYANSAQFRQGTETMLEELIHHNKEKVFGDIREMVLISQDDQNWLAEQFVPRAVRHGMRFLALVRPTYYFNKVAVETVAYKVNDEKLRIRFFNDPEEAKDWLASVG